MTTLQADNRVLTNATKYSYLVYNYVPATSNVTILNASDSDFAPLTYLLLGVFGSETAEIVQISTVNNTTGAIVLVGATKFAHSESTKVTVLPFNQIRFFWTPIEVFNTSTPLTVYVDIQPSDWFTTYSDGSHPTGYGWYIFFNSTTSIASQESNSLPYAGFTEDNLEDILNDFFSMLNNNELKLIKRPDALSFFNEANSLVRNRLNMSNHEYAASTLQTLVTQPNIYEYDLPKDFWSLLSIQRYWDPLLPRPAGSDWDNTVDYINLKDAFKYPTNVVAWPKVRYYIRNNKIGILPVPSQSATFSYMYLKKTMRMNSNSDSVDIPDNCVTIIKDFMLYRGHSKCGNPLAATDYKMFQAGLDMMAISSINRSANQNQMGIISEAMN